MLILFLLISYFILHFVHLLYSYFNDLQPILPSIYFSSPPLLFVIWIWIKIRMFILSFNVLASDYNFFFPTLLTLQSFPNWNYYILWLFTTFLIYHNPFLMGVSSWGLALECVKKKNVCRSIMVDFLAFFFPMFVGLGVLGCSE